LDLKFGHVVFHVLHCFIHIFIHTLFGVTIPLYKGVSRYFCNTFQQGVENFSALKKTLWKRHKNSGLRYGKLVEKAVYSWKTSGGFFGRVPWFFPNCFNSFSTSYTQGFPQ